MSVTQILTIFSSNFSKLRQFLFIEFLQRAYWSRKVPPQKNDQSEIFPAKCLAKDITSFQVSAIVFHGKLISMIRRNFWQWFNEVFTWGSEQP